MAGPCSLLLLPKVPESCALADEDVQLLATARHPNPERVLGPHLVAGHVVLRCWVSGAEEVAVASDVFLPTGGPDAREDPPSQVPLQQVAGCPKECSWLFEAAFKQEGSKVCEDGEQLRKQWDYQLQVKYGGGGGTSLVDPYCLGPLLPQTVLAAWASGKPKESPASTFGAHHMELREVRPGLWGTRFALWAPNARAVSLVGDLNFWNGRAHPMCARGDFGVWELFVPSWDLRGKKYGYQIVPSEGEPVIKADAFALEFVDPSDGGHDAKVPECDDFSRAAWNGTYSWGDSDWLAHRARAFSEENWASQPLSIYEVHLGSWAASETGEARGYRALAEPLAKHVQEMGFSAVELLPLSQYPCDQSWGYQCASGLYAVDSRLGTPDDFRHLVDTLHKHSIAVHIDFVGAHFAKDPWGLVRYSGAPQFEYEGDLGELPGWVTARFNYAKPEVRSYLLGAAEHWIESFHVDGLRLDAVAAMIYGSFGREEDGDAIMAGRGVVNEDGMALLRELCALVRARHPGVLLSAEESTNFKWVTSRPGEQGTERQSVQAQDLGFHLKWNMGFTYDTLAFLGTDFAQRPCLETFGWKKLAWYLAYAFNERWVLPLSHDNAHSRGLLDQMTAASEAEVKLQFAHFRMLLAYTVGMPGRPLLFMGSEVGEGAWSYQKPIDWKAALSDPLKKHLKEWVALLLKLYRDLPALHRQDDEAESFVWIDKDSSSRCVYAWRRRAKGAPDVVMVVNASPHRVSGYGVDVGHASGRAWRCAASTCIDADVSNGDSSKSAMVRVLAPGAAHFATDLPGCAAQLWVEDEEAAVVPDGSRRVEFELRHPAAVAGDVVCAIGGCPELGNWQPEAALRLATSPEAFPVWRATVDLPRDSASVELKFITVSAGGAVCWEPFDGNRRLGPAEGPATCFAAEFGRN